MQLSGPATVVPFPKPPFDAEALFPVSLQRFCALHLLIGGKETTGLMMGLAAGL